MTREEAIKVIKEHIDTYIVCHGEEDTVAVSIDNVDVEAFDMAIKALEREPSYNSIKTELEPCDDCISREAAILALTEEWTEFDDEILSACIRKIKALPSVTPQQKPNIKALGEDIRICQKSITDKKVLIGFNMAVALCNKHLAESEVQDADSY